MILYCSACRYTFFSETDHSASRDIRCPDCGKFAVRPATQAEVTEYERIRLEIEEEDKLRIV